MPSLPTAASLARPLVADGAMGTMLFATGLPTGLPPEAWLLEPDGAAAIAAVHRAHVGGGAQLVLTSTFGANRLRLVGSEVEGRTEEVCRAAVSAARAGGDADTIIAASMGPTGGLLVPYGLLDAGEVRAAYAEQASIMAGLGVDVLWVETMMDLNEALAALDGAREGAPGLPVITTMTFMANARTMFGDRAEAVAAALVEHGAAGIGANCGDGFGPVESVIPALAKAAPGLHIVAKANAGIPVADAEGNTVYPAGADEAATYAQRVMDAGATIIGGCCGTTPAHIAAIAGVVAGR
ncbi:MAG: homocysteine S-methyltransferase family protein [Chloroflexota bacterium]